jgi:hypothetical protein
MSAQGDQETHDERSAPCIKDRITFYPPRFPGEVISCTASSIHDKAFILDPIKRFAEYNRSSTTAAADDSQVFGDDSQYYEAIEEARAEEANAIWEVSVAGNRAEISGGINDDSSFMVLSTSHPTEPCLTNPKRAGQTSELPLRVISQPTTTHVPEQATSSPISSAFPT